MNNLNKEIDFISIPFISNEKEDRTYHAYYPIVLFDGDYDHDVGMTCGESMRLQPLQSMNDAIQAAKAACISMPNAIGYTVKGVDNV